MDWQERTRMLLGEDALVRLSQARVAVFGLGGVGGHCAEALCRAGVGHLLLVDRDTVSESNLNRQLCALRSTIGQKKAEVLGARLHDINPDCVLDTRAIFFNVSTAGQFDFSALDYVIDCIDDVSGKLLLIEQTKAAGTPILCCLGTGNKLDASRLEFACIENTSVCPLARVMRRELKARAITGVRALYSREEPIRPARAEGQNSHAPGSVSFVPAVAGLLLAGEAVRQLALAGATPSAGV